MQVRDLRLLVFDWDGTLMDSEAHIVACMQAACVDLNLAPLGHDFIRNVIGLGLQQAVAVLLPGRGSRFRTRFAERYRQNFLATADTASEFFPGAEETLRGLLAQGYLLAVATGKSRRGLDRALAQSRFRDVFHTTRCADETRSKPHPEMLLQIMQELRVEPKETVMIGDTEYDMAMAMSAGAYCMGVTYGVHEPERLRSYGPLAYLDRISDLEECLATTRSGLRNLPEDIVPRDSEDAVQNTARGGGSGHDGQG